MDLVLVAGVLLMSLVSAVGLSYHYDVVDEHSGWVTDGTEFQRALVGRVSGHLFVAAADRLLMCDSDMTLIGSVSVTSSCGHVTPCRQHYHPVLFSLLPTINHTHTGNLPSVHRRQRRRGCRGRIRHPGNIWSVGDEMSYIPPLV